MLIIFNELFNLLKGFFMPRPRCHRRLACHHHNFVFKPRGVAMSDLDVEYLGVDELEAMRLSDVEDMYQEEAAKIMGVSRSTFARMVASCHKKIVKALINKTAIEIITQAVANQEEEIKCQD